MNIAKKKLITFDFDGTLVDSMETFADIAATVMKQIYGTEFQTARQQYNQTSGLPFFQQLEQIHPDHEDNKTASNLFETRKVVGYFDQKPYADVPKTLEDLKKKSILTAVCSNNFQELVDRYIDKNNLKLDYTLGFRDEFFCKGEGHFSYLMNKTGLTKNEILFVGDSLKDAERAFDFGIDFVGKTGLFTKNDFTNHDSRTQVIDHLSELIDMIEAT